MGHGLGSFPKGKEVMDSTIMLSGLFQKSKPKDFRGCLECGSLGIRFNY